MGVSVCHGVSVNRNERHRVGKILGGCPVTLLQSVAGGNGVRPWLPRGKDAVTVG